MPDSIDPFDVVVVGAGPGGIAAAVTAADSGRRVGLVDDSPFAGGQIWRNRGEPKLPRAARHWVGRLGTSTVHHLRQSRVVARLDANTMLAETPDGPRRLRFDRLILATGARELFLPFPGWTLPGVVGAGGIQALVKQGLPVQGRRVVVAGTAPLLLAVAELLRTKGAIVPLILEQTPTHQLNRFALSLVRTPSKLFAGAVLRAKLWGTRYATDAYPVSAEQGKNGLRVSYRDRNAEHAIDCDLLACGFNLIPNNELAQVFGCDVDVAGFVRVDASMRTTTPDVQAIGELTGIGGVDKAVLEGRLAGYVVADHVAAARRLGPARASADAFARRLATAFALRPELLKLARPDTVVCRCEDVRLDAVMTAPSARDAKLQTRCGMGPCQGRVCGPILQRLTGAEPPLVRAPIFVTTVGALSAAGRAAGDAMSTRPVMSGAPCSAAEAGVVPPAPR